MKRQLCTSIGALLLLVTLPAAVYGQLQPMVAPVENPTTPEKAILGKFLFWEEQLSSDNSTACGTCHIPSSGGSDPRVHLPGSVHPGPDGIFGNVDDVVGSIGVVSQDCSGNEMDDGTFFPQPQVTGRRTPSFIGIGFSSTMFWDGRAGDVFLDPENPNPAMPVIASGGALENQAVGPIMSAVEMACDTRTWAEVKTKLAAVVPMALAENLPPDMDAALMANPTYPALFQAAFGTPEITAVRIGFAIASYERTLLPDQTPFDNWLAGDPLAMTQVQIDGFTVFNDNCQICHDGNELSDGLFHNIGLRPTDLPGEDIGRMAETGLAIDRGAFKTPPLRNVKLRAPYFHNGSKATLFDVANFYKAGGDFNPSNGVTNLDPQIFPLTQMTNAEVSQLVDFLENALTDPRVENELPPFDRPKLQPFFQRGDSNRDGGFDIADAVHVLEHLFGTSVPVLLCADASDANDDGSVNIADPVAMLARLFSMAAPLPKPSDISFGPDPTTDTLGCRP
ncbi:MAG: cytochrome c peroxidase [Planctomycetota bacterium]